MACEPDLIHRFNYWEKIIIFYKLLIKQFTFKQLLRKERHALNPIKGYHKGNLRNIKI